MDQIKIHKLSKFRVIYRVLLTNMGKHLISGSCIYN